MQKACFFPAVQQAQKVYYIRAPTWRLCVYACACNVRACTRDVRVCVRAPLCARYKERQLLKILKKFLFFGIKNEISPRKFINAFPGVFARRFFYSRLTPDRRSFAQPSFRAYIFLIVMCAQEFSPSRRSFPIGVLPHKGFAYMHADDATTLIRARI